MPTYAATLTGSINFEDLIDSGNSSVDFNLNFTDDGDFILEGSTATEEGQDPVPVINAMLDENGDLSTFSTEIATVNLNTGEIFRPDTRQLIGRNATQVPEPLTIFGTVTALGFATVFKRKYSKKIKSKTV
ncbi:MAG: PEP-CTERM sorting domain-containing protein [Cyanobacteria bacterium P01_D01_bin.116]